MLEPPRVRRTSAEPSLRPERAAAVCTDEESTDSSPNDVDEASFSSTTRRRVSSDQLCFDQLYPPWETDTIHYCEEEGRAPSPGIDPHVTPQEARAQSRNRQRISTRNSQDETTIRKFHYLPSEVPSFFPEPVDAPNDCFIPAPSFLQNLKKVHHTPVDPPAKPPFRFDTSEEALRHNAEVLSSADFDLERVLLDHQSTTLGFGSEFRPPDQLSAVFGQHPLLPKLILLVTCGMDYRFHRQLTEEERVSEMWAILERGNHKSAQENSAHVRKLLGTDVLRGFSLPLPVEVIPKLPGAMVQPLGMVTQSTIDEEGKRIPKLRLTHDLSFSATVDDASVNDRVDMSQYAEMVYGYCLPRILHWIVSLRRDNPNCRILLAKYDYSDAYRRMALSALAAPQSIAVFQDIAYLALRLTFGGSPNPAAFCTLSEMVADLANEILSDPSFDPSDFPLEGIDDLEAPEMDEKDTRPFAQAAKMAVRVHTHIAAKVDAFIDDLIAVFLDIPAYREKAHFAVPTAIHCTSRPLHPTDEPLPRRPNLSQSKLQAEGTPGERQDVLGWTLDSRALLVSLPHDKYLAWDLNLRAMLASKQTTFAELESTVGRLNHAAHVIPLARHFLNGLRSHLQPRRHPTKVIRLHAEDCRLIRLWRELLKKSTEGISMNRLVIREPSKIVFSDSCPFGLGGFLLDGRAWRIRIPTASPLYGLQIANNFLEFLAMTVNIWLQLVELDDNTESECILALGDNTSAIGWLWRTSKISEDSVYFKVVNMIANKLARIIIDSPHCLASQHFPGQLNTVSDYLSFEGETRGKKHPLAWDCPPDDVLTQRFHSYLPQLIPENFDIVPLPAEISSWIMQVL